MATRGRPVMLNKDRMMDILLKYKNEIIASDGKRIMSKCNQIWATIAKELENQVTTASLYTFVTCNRYGVRDKLCDRLSVSPCVEFHKEQHQIDDNEQLEITHSTDTTNITCMYDSFASTNVGPGISIFTITIPKSEFTSMLIYKTYRRKDKNRPSSKRDYTIMQPGTWQHVFCTKIWESTKITCGFNFQRSKLSRNGESGYANGTCKCGSVIKCSIDNTDAIITKIKCKFIEGEGRCGKRYLRNPIRQNIAQNLQGSSVMKYRVEMADKLMETDDNVEPPHLYSANVLRKAKCEVKQKNYLHKDPIKALEIMQLSSLKNILHNIGLNPFFAHYWSNYQLDVYRTYTADETACVYIDATGSIICKNIYLVVDVRR